MKQQPSNITGYKPNLDEFISQCELNYLLILKLLPWLNVSKNEVLFSEARGPTQFIAEFGQQIGLQLIEKARYTTTMLMNVYSPSRLTNVNISLMIRLYHDAQLLEVVDKVGPKALVAVNKGSTLLTKQVDEKRQLNRFLGESLKHCLQDNLLQDN